MAYPNPSSFVPMVIGTTDGPTLTAAAAASCIPVANRIQLPTNYWIPGKIWKIDLMGRISTAASVGTIRFDLRLGSAGNTVVFDTGAISQNSATLKTTVPFWLQVLLTCRAVGTGTSTTLFGQGTLQSEALIGSAANTAGGNASLLVPVGTPAVGSGFDNTAASFVDMFFTPSLATGSLTVHQYAIWEGI